MVPSTSFRLGLPSLYVGRKLICWEINLSCRKINLPPGHATGIGAEPAAGKWRAGGLVMSRQCGLRCTLHLEESFYTPHPQFSYFSGQEKGRVWRARKTSFQDKDVAKMKRKLWHPSVELDDAKKFVGKSRGSKKGCRNEIPDARNVSLVMETSGSKCPDPQKFHTAQETCRYDEEMTTPPTSAVRRSPLTGTAELTGYGMDLNRKQCRKKATTPVSGNIEISEIKDRYPFGEDGMTEQVEYWSLKDTTKALSVVDDVPVAKQDRDQDIDMDDLIYSEWLIYSKPLQTKPNSGSKVVSDIHPLEKTAQPTMQSKRGRTRRAYEKCKDLESQTETKTRVQCPSIEKTVLPKTEDSGTQARTRAQETGQRKESSLALNNVKVADIEYCTTAAGVVGDGDVRNIVKEEARHVSYILDRKGNISNDTSQRAVREGVLVGDKHPPTTMGNGSVVRMIGLISEQGDGLGNTDVNRPHSPSAVIDAEGECCNDTDSQIHMECDDSPKDASHGTESRELDNCQHIIEQVPCNYQASDVKGPTAQVKTARPDQNPSNTDPSGMTTVTQDCSRDDIQSQEDDHRPQRTTERLVGGQGRTDAASTFDQEAKDANLLKIHSRKPHGSGKSNIVHSPNMRKAKLDEGTSSSSRSRRHDLDEGPPRTCTKLEYDRSTRRHARYNYVSKEGCAQRRNPACDSKRRLPDSGCRRGFKNRRSPPFVRCSRNGGGYSGLGGYSPRRRRFNGTAQTPSSPKTSPGKKNSSWDLPPSHENVNQRAKLDGFSPAATCAGSAAPCTSFAVTTASSSLLPSLKQQLACPFTSLTMIQAPRTLRRLYIGNVPASVSDGELLELLNAAMLSANIGSIPGTKPCVNCVVHVEKNYAFAEFVTPEDATAALAFDGVMLHGTVLKIKRPKDYVQPVNGAPTTAPYLVSNMVPDSPHKIFLGGISFSLSAQKEKVKEIVTSFGQLKSFHWEVDASRFPPQVYAFFEYMDPQVTLKACAGLNGLPIANSIWTCVQANQDASSKISDKPSYSVPSSAMGLLQAPTHILEFQNLMDEEEFLAMSETEVFEYVEDIRIECSRFGRMKAMHVIKPPPLNANPESQQEADVSSTTGLSMEHGTTSSKQGALQTMANKESQNNFHRNWGNWGRIYVEYAREDSAVRAASCLHGRTYGGKKAMIGYFPAEGAFGELFNAVKVDLTKVESESV